MTIAMGNAKDMEKAITTLNEVKASIVNAYQRKTGLSRNKISQLMEDETWMNAKKAVDLGFADEVLFAKGTETDETEGESDGKEIEAVWQPYSTRIMGQTILNRISCTAKVPAPADEESVEAEDDQASVEPIEAEMSETATVSVGDTSTEREATENTGQAEEAETAQTSEDVTDEAEAPDPKPDPTDMLPDKPVIGMDGKTKDGAMPYELLKKQLDYLR